MNKTYFIILYVKEQKLKNRLFPNVFSKNDLPKFLKTPIYQKTNLLKTCVYLCIYCQPCTVCKRISVGCSLTKLIPIL